MRGPDLFFFFFWGAASGSEASPFSASPKT